MLVIWADHFLRNKYKTLLETMTISPCYGQFLDAFTKERNFNNHAFFTVSSRPFNDPSPQGGRKTTQLTNNGSNQPLFCLRITTLKVLPPK